MNRVEFQKWLDQFPEDTEIEVVLFTRDDSAAIVVPFDEFNDNHHDFVDFTGNPFVDLGRDVYDKKYLRLGQDR